MIRSSRPRKAANLSEALHRQVNSYALAASAAGVGVLAFGQSAQAKIVYTAAHVNITPNHTIPLDLTRDGVADFILQDIHSTTQAVSHKGFLSEIPARNSNAVVGFSRFGRLYASALQAGASIGPDADFAGGQRVMATIFSDTGRDPTGTSNRCNGAWDKAGNRYLGLKFHINGETHFGWARLSVHCDSRSVEATLSGYAYETDPNTSIIAGKTSGSDADVAADPASLGVLMLGRK